MQIDFQVRYSTKEKSFLCFKHAVMEAMNNEDVTVDFDDWQNEHYLGPSSCVECRRLYDFGVRDASSVG